MCQRFSTRQGVVIESRSTSPQSLAFEMQPLQPPLFASMSAFFMPEKRPFVPVLDIAKAAAASNDVSNLRVAKMKGDGRCMFRAIAQGLARNQGRFLGPTAEEQEADQLRLAVAEALCRTHKRRSEFGDAVISLEAEDNITNYCRRIVSPTFWGGEPELLVLSKMLKVPIFIYLANSEVGAKKSARGGFTILQKYGEKYTKPGKDWKKRKPVRLLYTNGNHYDLLIS